MFPLDKALMLVIERGRLMAEAGAQFESGMAAVLGMDQQRLESILLESKEKAVVVANYNCPGQIVISGEKAQLDSISDRLKEAGAKRVIPLKVGGAFHSPVMHPAAEGLATYLTHIPVMDPVLPIVLNRTAEESKLGQEIKDQLPLQVKSPVRWEQSLRQLSTKVTRFIECGPGKVLQGLSKKTVDTPVVSVYNKESLESFLASNEGEST